MTAAPQSDHFTEQAWLLPNAQDWSCLSEAACRVQETRIAASLFKRRFRLLVHWRRQTIERVRERAGAASRKQVAQLCTSSDSAVTVTGRLPRELPVLNEEIAILRAFLAHDINAILFGDAS